MPAPHVWRGAKSSPISIDRFGSARGYGSFDPFGLKAAIQLTAQQRKGRLPHECRLATRLIVAFRLLLLFPFPALHSDSYGGE
jgi:hypothetical protein